MAKARPATTAQRASRGNQLAAAFTLAFLRGDSLGMASILEDVADDAMPFAIGLACHTRTLADMTASRVLLERHLVTAVRRSADLAVDPDAQDRIERGQI